MNTTVTTVAAAVILSIGAAAIALRNRRPSTLGRPNTAGYGGLPTAT
ncbi:hypothetical protein [Leifsonia sp. Leaf264]|nr:hypothetical protein [Leifsonia sp. Leaf264]